MIDLIKTKAKAYFSEIVAVRQHLHQYPELSKQEFSTADYLCQQLDKVAGVTYRRDVGGMGIVGWVSGENEGLHSVALRADMDALPILEDTGLPFSSKNNGVMHACGHDVHMACLLGAVRILSDLRNDIKGRAWFVFQPSEEEFPGGATLMLKEKLFGDTLPQAIFALHTTPEIDAGQVGMKAGEYMASTDEIYLRVVGKGGHGATPHLNSDPIVAAAHVIVALQTLVSRHANPSTPTTLSFGKIIGNGRTNIIPNEVKMEGIIRTFDETWRQECHCRIGEIARNVAAAMDCHCEVFIDAGYPFVYNHPELTQQSFEWAEQYLGNGNVLTLDLRMTSEDFSYFARQIPGCYFRLGTRKKDQPITNLHTNCFDVDERSIEIGMGLMAWYAYQTLNNIEQSVMPKNTLD